LIGICSIAGYLRTERRKIKMPDDMMVMLGSASAGDWDGYIKKLIASGKFRGGSSLGNGILMTK
jgi:hypothetical protein